MPRINTPTLHEQRVWRRNQLMSAAAQITLENGLENLTISAIADRAGLSRTSVYEYFSSKEELVRDLIIDELHNYVETLRSAIDKEADYSTQIAQWIERALTYIAEGNHLLVKSLNAALPLIEDRSGITAAHRQLLDPLRQTLINMRISDIDQALSLIRSVTDGATKRIESGVDPKSEIEASISFINAGLAALKKS